jgi:hypothetical protein
MKSKLGLISKLKPKVRHKNKKPPNTSGYGKVNKGTYNKRETLPK